MKIEIKGTEEILKELKRLDELSRELKDVVWRLSGCSSVSVQCEDEQDFKTSAEE